MRRMLWTLILSLLFSLLSVSPAGSANSFLQPGQAFQFNVTHKNNEQVQLSWRISEGYYLYRKQLKIESEPPGSLQDITFPAGTAKTDEFFGTSEVYRNRVDLLVTAPGAHALHIEWQGCADAGLCYPPQIRRVVLRPAAKSGDISLKADNHHAASIFEESSNLVLSDEQNLAMRLSHGNLVWTLIVFAGLGLLMSMTPCILPMIPILSSLIAGSGAGPRRGLVLSLSFVLPLALTYAVLGATAALLGANMQSLQNPWMLGLYGLLFVMLALAMFGVVEFQLPAFLRNRLGPISQNQRGGTVLGAAVMGMLSALLVGPCMTAPLAGALLYIGNTSDLLTGALALFALGLGMGAPLLLVGTLGARLLPQPGEWMNRVRVFFGFVLLAMAIIFVGRVLPFSLVLCLWGAWLLAFSASMTLLEPKLAKSSGRILTRSTALLSGLWGVLLIVGAAAGADDPWHPLALPRPAAVHTRTDTTQDTLTGFSRVETSLQLSDEIALAGQRGQWTLVDFYADWCSSCKAIEREVFSDPRVQQALTGMQLLRPDVTVNNADVRAMLATYQAFGAPTILLIGPDGKEHRPSRIIGELSANEFLSRLQRAREDA